MPRVALLYQFYEPDTVVSARHYGDLATGLQRRGWTVEAWPSNRLRRPARSRLAARETIEGVTVRRCWRLPLSQDSSVGRIVNTAFMLGHWCLRALRRDAPDVVVVGTDPPFGVWVARVWKWLRPRTRVVHWCFDLYPDAAVAEEMLSAGGLGARVLRAQAAKALGACDAVVDIGPGMRARLAALATVRSSKTLVPWALVESRSDTPPARASDDERAALFGPARAVCLYAGRLGKAHEATRLIELARELEEDGVLFAFSGIGEREAEVRALAGSLRNVRFLERCSEDELLRRLVAADLHVVSLKERWGGVVVPSKFFAALAAGRPVLYDGPAGSCVERWISTERVGVHVRPESVAAVADEIRALLADRPAYDAMAGRCATLSRRSFSKDSVIAGWDGLLREVVGNGPGASDRQATVGGQPVSER